MNVGDFPVVTFMRLLECLLTRRLFFYYATNYQIIVLTLESKRRSDNSQNFLSVPN